MARKRHSDEDILKLLREIKLHLAGGADVATACRAAGVSDATYYIYGRLSRCKWFEAGVRSVSGANIYPASPVGCWRAQMGNPRVQGPQQLGGFTEPL